MPTTDLAKARGTQQEAKREGRREVLLPELPTPDELVMSIGYSTPSSQSQ